MKMFNKLILILLPFCLFSQQNLFDKELFIVEEDTLRYRVLAPLDYEKDKKYPVHLVLHGSGERGNDNELQLFHGSNLFLNKKKKDKNINHGSFFHKLQKMIGGVAIMILINLIMK